MLKVGITGGIGSGKSTVCLIFANLGIPIYNADLETKQLYLENPLLKKALIDNFGSETYLPSGEVNKEYLRTIVQTDEGNKGINNVVHPFVFEHFEQWVSKQSSPYIIKEAAILFESGANKTVNKVIGVTAPSELKMKRVQSRDGFSMDTIQKIISKQLSEKELIEKCDYLINNDETEPLITQVLKIHRELLDQSSHF